MKLELKKIKGSSEKKKKTLSLSDTAYELYEAGKANGWDTPDLACQAVEQALLDKRDQLLSKKSG